MKQNILILTNIIIILAVGFLAYTQHNKGRNYYFATTEDMKLYPAIPMDDPLVPDHVILSQTKTAMLESFDFNAENYRQKLKDVSAYYTKRGWESFTTALQKSRTVEAVVDGSAESSSIEILSEPEIIEKGVKLRRYNWLIKMPVKIQMGERQNEGMMEVLVVRNPRAEAPSGVGVEQVVFSDMNTSSF